MTTRTADPLRRRKALSQPSAPDVLTACALRTNGHPICWGMNLYGQASPPPGESLKYISSGDTHTCGVRLDGSLVCWGSNDREQASPPEGRGFTAVASSRSHTCAIREDGTTTCWGADYSYQATPPEGALLKYLDAGTAYSLYPGFSFTCGLRVEDDTLACWGHSLYREPFPRHERFMSCEHRIRSWLRSAA